MKRVRSILGVTLLTLTLLISPTPGRAQKPPRQYTIEQFMNTLQMGGISFSADEKSLLIYCNKSSVFNAYSIAVNGGAPVQLTHSTKESTFAISYLPTDARILYTHDSGGNENNHIYLQELDGNERDLTPGAEVKANFIRWSHDGKSLFFSTNERDPRFLDLYEMPIDSFKPSLIYKNETGLNFADISKDRKYLAFTNTGDSPGDSDIYLYNTTNKQLTNITAHVGEVANRAQTFDVGSQYLYYLTTGDSEFNYVARYDLTTGKSEVVEKRSGDIFYTYFSHNGKYRVTAFDEDTRTRIRIDDQTTGTTVSLPFPSNAIITDVKVSPSEKLMAFYLKDDRSPSNLYVYNFATRKTIRLTDAMNPEIDRDDLVDGQLVKYKSFDGLEIPAILYKPKQASVEHRVPALLWIHGGPGGQTRFGYSPLTQFLVNHGYVVLAVNNRGSSGYGKTFFAADDRKHGREPLWDCVEAKKYLALLDYVDGSRVGIAGSSYGGYMVLAALAFRPKEFSVGVDLFGVSNWVRTLQSIPPYWESFRKSLYKEIGDPNTDLDYLRAVSPLFHADEIVRPLIVLQGANDVRVLKAESDEIVDSIRKRHGVVEYVVFEDEGHDFDKKSNEIRAYEAILGFLDRYLKGKK